MSDDVNTGIERIPVELWHEIFQYFYVHDLWNCFRCLNRRIDAIIDQTSLHMSFSRSCWLSDFIENIHPSINPANVQSLFMRTPDEITEFFSIYSLKSLTQLRRLSLEYMFTLENSTFQLWKELASLKYLQSLKVTFWPRRALEDAVGDQEFLISSLGKHDFYPALNSFEIATCGSRTPRTITPPLIPATKTTNLRHVSIDCLTFSDLIALFPAMQDIESIRISRQVWADEESIKSPPAIATHLLSKCKRLPIELEEKLAFEHVEYLLRCIPNLKMLSLTGPRHFIDAKKWERLLSKYCQRQMAFHFISIGQMTDESFRNVLLDFKADCYASSFWLERSVALVIDQSNRLSARDYRADFVVGFDFRKQ